MAKIITKRVYFEDTPLGTQGIFQRRLQLCNHLRSWSFPELLKTCHSCSRFYLHCCHHDQVNLYQNSYGGPLGCHHFKVVFCNGACRHNGAEFANAGVGIAYGPVHENQMAIEINDTHDYKRSTSQRAELVAAIEAVKILTKICHEPPKSHHGNELERYVGANVGIVITDSEYVVKGMTILMPSWKKNNWKAHDGRPPHDLDLFKRLDSAVTEAEVQGNKIGFYHVGREYNILADGLAKWAAGIAR